MKVPFRKMNGAGNDFVVLDGRQQPVLLTTAQVQRIAARDNAATRGCDQVIVMEPSTGADVFMRIFNASGSEVEACGNATRCIAWRLMAERSTGNVAVQTRAGTLRCQKSGDGRVTVDMGEPNLNWQAIPLVREMDTLNTGIYVDEILQDPVACNIGNPHTVFLVEDDATLMGTDMKNLAETVQPFFPQGVNASVAYIKEKGSRTDGSPATIHARVWERGVGETQACGTAACAILVAAWLREPVSDRADIIFQPGGGRLSVEWLDKEKNARSLVKGSVKLTGPVEEEFEGTVEV